MYTDNIQDADIVIFHTCAIKQKSEDKVSGKLKILSPHQKVRITWCMIQHNLKISKIYQKKWGVKVGNFLWSIQKKQPQVIWKTTKEIKDIENCRPTTPSIIPINHAFNPLFHNLQKKRKNIELMRRIDDTGFLPMILKHIWYEITYDQEYINEYDKIIPEHIQTSMNNHHTTAYIPISTWCNQFCSYCIVPYARGREKHFSLEQIVNEAKIHLKNGAKEIVLLWQIVNKHPEFVHILKEILQLPWLKRLRYTSPYPIFYDKELLALHEQEEKLCPHIHMPLQSGSNEILKKMLRGYTVEQAKTFIDTIKNLKREISITTDIIVSFPNETEEDFEQTLSLIKYGNFDMIYIGIYSPRPGTFAEKTYPDNISRETKHDRRERLNTILQDLSRQNNEKEIGKTTTILINKIHAWITEGYTDNMKQVLLEDIHTYKKGEFIDVEIVKAIPFKLYAKSIK